MTIASKLRALAGLDDRESATLDAILSGPAAADALSKFDQARIAERDALCTERAQLEADELRDVKPLLAVRAEMMAAYDAARRAMDEAFANLTLAHNAVTSREHAATQRRHEIDRALRSDPDERIAPLFAELDKAEREMLTFEPFDSIEAGEPALFGGGRIDDRLYSNRPAQLRRLAAVRQSRGEAQALYFTPASELPKAIKRLLNLPAAPTSGDLEEVKL